MTRSQRKNVRKLVSLSPGLGGRRVGRSFGKHLRILKSDALKVLIEDGLKLRDRREDYSRDWKLPLKNAKCRRYY